MLFIGALCQCRVNVKQCVELSKTNGFNHASSITTHWLRHVIAYFADIFVKIRLILFLHYVYSSNLRMNHSYLFFTRTKIYSIVHNLTKALGQHYTGRCKYDSSAEKVSIYLNAQLKLSWFGSYLSNRQQRVRANHAVYIFLEGT